MPLVANDFVVRLSGGASNSVGNDSLGGAKSSNAASTTVDQLFDGVSSAEASAGDTEYRCVYLHNANGSSSMLTAVVWIGANTPNSSTTLDIGVGTAAVNGTEQTIANEATAPTSVSFSAPSSQGAGLALGDIPAGQHKAIWLRRTVTAGASTSTNDTWQLNFAADYTS